MIYDRRAEAYGMLGEPSLVVNDYNRAIELSPSGPSRFVRRGVGLFALGRLEEAIQGFDEAIELYDTMIRAPVESQKNRRSGQVCPEPGDGLQQPGQHLPRIGADL